MANNRQKISCLIICLSLGLAATLAHSEINFNNPVRPAAEDEVTALPGLKSEPKFKHYSGYLEADDEKPTNRFWHYWFVESKSDPANDPLVLWLNGGPGCSSLLGLLTELGPFRPVSSSQLEHNPWSWNNRANVIFMESPAGVGFSYAVNGDTKADDDTTARQNHHALKSFLRKFPQYKNNPLYLTGESYAGVYLPTLGVLIDKDPEFNLKGIAIGNGYLDASKLAESLVYFSYYHGLVGRSVWDGISKYCCNGKAPARGDCSIISPDRSQSCTKYVAKATDDILSSGINPYNLYDRCQGSNNQRNLLHSIGSAKRNYQSYRENVDKRLILSAFNITGDIAKKSIKLSVLNKWSPSKPQGLITRQLAADPPCTDDSVVVDYLNRPDVRQALHIPEKLTTPFSTCFDGIAYDMIYPAQEGGLAPQIRSLIASKRGLKLLVYNGDVDLMCNFFGDEWFVDDLGRKIKKDYRPWFTAGQISGFSKYFDGIAYFTVKGSGHMVPGDKPAEALNMFEHLLDGLNSTEKMPYA